MSQFLSRAFRPAVYAGVVLAGSLLAAPSHAALIYPTTATASSAFSGYPAADSIDTGVNNFVTDWASNSQGTSSFLDLSFSQVEQFASVFVTDRTTSGGPNNAFFGGLFDYTTQFSIQAYSDASFTTPVGSPLIFSKPLPATHSSVADFQVTESLGGLSAQFLRYSVLAAQGANPGLADIEFNLVATPEPAALILFGSALLGMGLVRRRIL